MICFQQWTNDSFEYNYLKKLKDIIKDKPDQKIYIGFDYGFFNGVNIYYGTNRSDFLAKQVYKSFKENRINIRLFCNIPFDFDVIILLGYTNLIKERQYLLKNKSKIMKALSFL